MWVGAAIASIYFLYLTLASTGPWSNLLWSIGAGLVARFLTVVLNRNKQRVDYVGQLMERGYAEVDAEAAWRTAAGGGTNLLRNLQQAEMNDEIHRAEKSIDTSGTEGDSE